MKRLFATVLAVVMLLASVACAEETSVGAEAVADASAGAGGMALMISNPKLSIVSSEKQMALDLSGLSLALLTDPSAPNTYVIEVRGDDDVLMRAQYEIEGTRRVLFALDDVTGVFSYEFPQTATATQAVAEAQPGEEGAAATASSAFDVNALVQKAMAGVEIDTSASPMTFKAPYTAVNEILSMLLPMMNASDFPGISIKDARAKVNEWIKQDSGYSVEGTFASDDDSMAFSGMVIPVTAGEAGEPVFTVSFSMDDLGIRLDTSLAGLGAMSFSVAPQDDMQLLTVSFNSDGANITINAEITAVEEAFDFQPLDTTTVISVQDMTKAESAQFATEFSQVTGKVFEYVFNILKNASSAVISEVVEVAEEETAEEVPAA